MVNKGKLFEGVAAFDRSVAQGAPLIEAIMTKALGKDFLLSSSTGFYTSEGGQPQPLHQDQGEYLVRPPPRDLVVPISAPTGLVFA